MHAHTYAAPENICACMTLSTRWSTDTKTHNLCTNMHTHTHTHVYKRIDVQIHTHMHIYTYIHVCTHTHIHIYRHTHTKCIYERTQARLERRRGSRRARSRYRPRKLCTSLSFDAIKPHFAPPMQGLYCTHVLKHQYPSSGAAEPHYASTQESKPENDQSDCSRETKGQWRTTSPHKQPITQITTARRPDNTRSSALVRSQSTKFMSNPCRKLWSRCSEIGSYCYRFPAVVPVPDLCLNLFANLLMVYAVLSWTEAHTHKHICTIRTQEKWWQPGTRAWLRGAKEKLC